jgi:hypothetical protein
VTRRARPADGAEERLKRAEEAADTVAAQGERVEKQVSLSQRLLAGWRKVHESNHLAQLFHDEGRI